MRGRPECLQPRERSRPEGPQPRNTERELLFETLIQDLRHGLRMLVKNPGFSLVAIASIAVGVAACAAMFSVADGMVLRPLPVPRGGDVVTINGTAPDDGGRGTGISYLAYKEFHDTARSFTGVAAR